VSKLIVILDRVLTADAHDQFMVWVDRKFEQARELAGGAELLRAFFNHLRYMLVERCVDVLSTMTAVEKRRFGFQQFMTADEVESVRGQ